MTAKAHPKTMMSQFAGPNGMRPRFCLPEPGRPTTARATVPSPSRINTNVPKNSASIAPASPARSRVNGMVLVSVRSLIVANLFLLMSHLGSSRHFGVHRLDRRSPAAQPLNLCGQTSLPPGWLPAAPVGLTMSSAEGVDVQAQRPAGQSAIGQPDRNLGRNLARAINRGWPLTPSRLA